MCNLLVLCPKIFKQKLTDLEQDHRKPSYPKPDSMRVICVAIFLTVYLAVSDIKTWSTCKTAALLLKTVQISSSQLVESYRILHKHYTVRDLKQKHKDYFWVLHVKCNILHNVQVKQRLSHKIKEKKLHLGTDRQACQRPVLHRGIRGETSGLTLIVHSYKGASLLTSW